MAKKKKRTLKKKHTSKKHASKKHLSKKHASKKQASKKHVSKKHTRKKKLKPSYSPKAKGAISGTTFMLEDVVSPSPEPITSSPKI